MLGDLQGLCGGDVESVVVHGANRVCQQQPHPNQIVSALVVSGLLAGALVSRFRENARRYLPIVLALAAIPGLVATAWLRADAPPRAASAEREVRNALHALRADANENGCAHMLDARCDACTPLARFAVADHRECRAPGKPSSVAPSCNVREHTFSCGAP